MSQNQLSKKKLLEKFKKHLQDQGFKKNTYKNYLSDLTHFLNWLESFILASGLGFSSYIDVIKVNSSQLSYEYKKYLLNSYLPNKSVNRRLSGLRAFSKFLFASQLIDKDLTQGISNIHIDQLDEKAVLVRDYRRHLSQRGVSKNTLKNYLSDVRHFLNWLETQKQF